MVDINDFPDEIWDLKAAIAEFIAPRLSSYIQVVEKGEIISIPNWINEEGYQVEGKTIEELNEKWSEILKEMLFPFDYHVNANESRFDLMSYQEKELKKQRGLLLFSKYFNHLWD